MIVFGSVLHLDEAGAVTGMSWTSTSQWSGKQPKHFDCGCISVTFTYATGCRLMVAVSMVNSVTLEMLGTSALCQAESCQDSHDVVANRDRVSPYAFRPREKA